MALDHYVSQVHLRQFCFPDEKGKLFVVKKSNLREFTTAPVGICAVKEGNINDFLPDPTALEKLFAVFEPNYPQAITELRERKKSYLAREVVSIFMAAVNVAAPAFRRIIQPLSHAMLKNEALKIGKLPDVPNFPIVGKPEYDGRSFHDLISEGRINFEIDMRGPQALAISKIPNVVQAFAESNWDVLHLEDGASFLTSDFPLAQLELKTDGHFSRFLPLARDLGVVVYTSRSGTNNFPTNTHYSISSRSQVSMLNRCVVRSAEEHVIAFDRPSWLPTMVKKYRNDCLGIDPMSGDLAYTIRQKT